MKDVILIDKPAGWTSFDVVAKIRSKIRAEYVAAGEKPTKKQLRVGHAGTLDPFATGLLVILLGDACKQAGEFLKLDKSYEFTAKLGEVSTTGDPEGVISKTQNVVSNKRETQDAVIPDLFTVSLSNLIPDPVKKSKQVETVSNQMESIKIPTSDDVHKVLRQFTGEITQTPPAYSAIKINGKRAYKLAREGKRVEVPSRQVTIRRLEVTGYEYPYLKCVCDVSSGTYIRSLVEDIGKALKTGAYCTELRRLRVGAFDISAATVLDELIIN